MNERYIKWYTPWLSREFEMLVFGNGGGLPLILFPTSGARYYENKDFGLVGSVAGYIDSGKITVYCPDAIDLESLYNKSIHPADRIRTDARCDRTERPSQKAQPRPGPHLRTIFDPGIEAVHRQKVSNQAGCRIYRARWIIARRFGHTGDGNFLFRGIHTLNCDVAIDLVGRLRDLPAGGHSR